MHELSRRALLGWGIGLTGAAAAGTLGTARAQAARYAPLFPVEKGASLRLLRWSGFVKSDEEVWDANTRKFTEATGVPVAVEYITWEDVRPKSALAANLGSGPDIVMGWYDDPHLYSHKLLDVSDVAEFLGQKYGGWYDVAQKYGYSEPLNRWVAVPIGGPMGTHNYRVSWMRDAGFDKYPDTLEGFLRLAKALKQRGHPTGFGLGHAVADGTGWTHWLFWAMGGRQVEPDGKTVAINQHQTWDALVFARALYDTMVPGVGAWLDPNNNRAFLAGEISLTSNGISIYYAAKKDFPQIAADMDHAFAPVGPVGRPTQWGAFSQAFVFKHSKAPNAAKEYIRFMLEAEQTGPWVEAMNGYVTPALKAYRELPVWTRDPKVTPFRDCIGRILHSGYAGRPGPQAAAALAEFVVLDMFADTCVNGMSPKASASRAEDRLRRIYR